jgi:hypothetical protein
MGSAPTKTYIPNRNGTKTAARFIKHEYSRDPGIVTSIMQELELQALQERRKTSRLLVFHKITHQKVAIPLPPYLRKPTRTTRQYHPRRFVRIGPTGDQRKHSFFVMTIKDWNDLPPTFKELMTMMHSRPAS